MFDLIMHRAISNSIVAKYLAPSLMLLLVACGGGGGDSGEKPTIPVTGQNTPPTISITSPSDNQTIGAGASITFTASALDSEDGNISQNVRWTSSVGGDLGSGASVSAALSVATHQITASITDSDGATSQTQITLTITATTNQAPQLTIAGPDNLEIGAQAPYTFYAQAQDTEDGDISTNIQWVSSLDGELGEGGEVTVQLSPGAHTLTASVVDSDGNQGQSQVNLIAVSATGVATVSWTRPTQNMDESELQDLTGFRIYYGTSSNNLSQIAEIDNPNIANFVLENLHNNKTYYFGVVAVNSLGIESDLSAIASKYIPD